MFVGLGQGEKGKNGKCWFPYWHEATSSENLPDPASKEEKWTKTRSSSEDGSELNDGFLYQYSDCPPTSSRSHVNSQEIGNSGRAKWSKRVFPYGGARCGPVRRWVATISGEFSTDLQTPLREDSTSRESRAKHGRQTYYREIRRKNISHMLRAETVKYFRGFLG